MTIQELKDYILVNTSLDLSEEDIDDNVLTQLVNAVLPIYGKYRSLDLRDRFRIRDFSIVFDRDNNQREIIGVRELYVFNPELSNYKKFDMNWHYDTQSKILYVGLPGTYIINYLAMPTLDDIRYTDTLFLNMMLGKFMMYIGEQRKQFIINDIPISDDGESLYDQGLNLYNDTLENLSNNLGNWYYGINYV